MAPYVFLGTNNLVEENSDGNTKDGTATDENESSGNGILIQPDVDLVAKVLRPIDRLKSHQIPPS